VHVPTHYVRDTAYMSTITDTAAMQVTEVIVKKLNVCRIFN